MANEFVARNGVIAQNNSIITGSLIVTDLSTLSRAQITGSLGVTGSVQFSTLTTAVGPTAWSTGGAMNVARITLAGAGTQGAALAFGGYAPNNKCTEAYNGTSWTPVAAMANGGYTIAGAGTQTAAIAMGAAPTGCRNCTELYDGATWSGGGALIVGRCAGAAAGIQSATLFFGGSAPSTQCTELYNGTAWSTGNALITGRNKLGGSGLQGAALAFGGCYFGAVACTEGFNGTSWSTKTAMIAARFNLAGAGTSTATIAFGGGVQTPSPGTFLSCTETYNGSTWSTGVVLITGRRQLAGAGSPSAGLAFGGRATPGVNVACTELYGATTTTALIKTFDYSDTTGQVSATGSLFGTASYATSATVFPYTGSAIISGSALITGSLSVLGNITATGTLTAQTLVVQTITSSIVYSSGSNIFGNALSNTQIFTGSVSITGSLSVFNGVSNLTASRAVSSSYAVSASYAPGSAGGSFPYSGSAQITGSLGVTGSAVFSSTVTATGAGSNTVLAGTGLKVTSANTGLYLNFSPSYTGGLEAEIASSENGLRIVAAGSGVNTMRFLTSNSGGTATLALSINGTQAATFASSVTINTPSSATALALWGRSGDNFSALRFNSNSGATNYATIYTDASNLLFETAGTTRLTIASTGAATFSSRLNINGAVDDGSTALKVSGGGTFSGNITATATLTTAPSTGTGLYLGFGTTPNNFNGINFQGNFATDVYFGRAVSSDDLVIRTTAGEKIRFTTAGAGTFSSTLSLKGGLTIVRSNTIESSVIDNEGNLNYNARDNFNHVFKSNGTEIARISTTGAATFSSSVQSDGSSNGFLINQNGGAAGLATYSANTDRAQIAFKFAQNYPASNNYTRVLDIVATGDATGGSNIRLFTSAANSAPSAALTIASTGAATFSSSVTATSFIETSTIRVKENVVPLESTLSKVLKLQGVSYNKIGSTTKEIGLIAEAVEEVYPEFVQYDENGEPSGLHYSRLTAVLIESIKELKQEIEILKTKIK